MAGPRGQAWRERESPKEIGPPAPEAKSETVPSWVGTLTQITALDYGTRKTRNAAFSKIRRSLLCKNVQVRMLTGTGSLGREPTRALNYLDDSVATIEDWPE